MRHNTSDCHLKDRMDRCGRRGCVKEGISSVQDVEATGGFILSSIWCSNGGVVGPVVAFCEAFKSEANFSTIFMYERVSPVAIINSVCLIFKRSKDCAAQFSSCYFHFQLPLHAFSVGMFGRFILFLLRYDSLKTFQFLFSNHFKQIYSLTARKMTEGSLLSGRVRFISGLPIPYCGSNACMFIRKNAGKNDIQNLFRFFARNCINLL